MTNRPHPSPADDPDLSTLTAPWAGDAEQFAQEAAIAFKNQVDWLRERLKTTERGTRYYAATLGLIERLQQLQDRARTFREAANRRCREAQRTERKVA